MWLNRNVPKDAMTILQSKPILLLSPLPPPQGGIATWTKKVIEHGLPDGSLLELIDTRIRGDRNIFDRASLSFSELTRTFRILCQFIFCIYLKKPRIIHINCSLSSIGVFRDWLCAKIASLSNIPLVVHYHGNLPDFQKQRFARVSFSVLLRLMKMAKMNIVINQLSFNKARDMCCENVRLVPNFIEESLFKCPIRSSKKALLRAVFAGGITQAKGCGEIYHLAKEFPEIEFYLFGKMHADMNDLYKTIPANLFLKGEISHLNLLEELQQGDFLLFPSYSEGFPLAVLEAMTMGLPVIATRVGAIPDMIVAGRGGFVVEAGDISGLMESIKTISQNESLRRAMGDFNRKFSFENYRYSEVIQQLVKIYNEIMEKQKCVE